jgi:hypothetical protein
MHAMTRHDVELQRPSLRISHVVHGRLRKGRRVTYLLDPHGEGDRRHMAERVVLGRWRRRQLSGYTFSGCPLSSTLWRALPVWLGSQVEEWHTWSAADLEARWQRLAGELDARNLAVPDGESAKALIHVCGPSKLRALVERHARRGNRSGVPDLFLFARALSGRVVMARFVEVKKPEEPVSEDQREEIDFMLALGLNARVLRLQERK